jgi:predicted small lipoprotein YifL
MKILRIASILLLVISCCSCGKVGPLKIAPKSGNIENNKNPDTNLSK